MKKIFFNAHLIDENLDSKGAVLVQDGFIKTVVLGDFADCDAARGLVPLFGNTEDCSKGSCSSCGTPCSDNYPEFINCRGKTLMPGFIDMHVHFRYPGQSEKEDLNSGTKAAAAGGYSLVVLMPNTNPVVSSGELAHSIEADCAKFGRVDAIQTVSLTKDFDGKTTSHIDDLEGVSIMTEDGRDVQDSLAMYDAMSKCGAKGILVSCHCEDSSFTAKAKESRKIALENYAKYDSSADKSTEDASYALFMAETYMEEANDYLAMAEDFATIRNVQLGKDAECRVHMAHVSTARAIDAVRKGKQEGIDVTAEAMPHHFGLSTANAENLRYVVNPPIRSEEDRLAIIQAIKDGTVDVISTDHAPHTMQDKLNGAPGFPGLETAFAVANTTLVKEGHISLQKLSSLMSAAPARLLEIGEESASENPRGKIKAGLKADLVLVDEDEEWTVDSTKFYTKGAMSPFDGMELTGKVLATWHDGNKVFGE